MKYQCLWRVAMRRRDGILVIVEQGAIFDEDAIEPSCLKQLVEAEGIEEVGVAVKRSAAKKSAT